MHGLTHEEHRKHLRDFAWLFLALFVAAIVIAGFLAWRGETRAAQLVAGIFSTVCLLCAGMQIIELRQLEKRP